MAAWRYKISLRVLKSIFRHEKRHFISPCRHLISSMYVVIQVLLVNSKTNCTCYDIEACF